MLSIVVEETVQGRRGVLEGRMLAVSARHTLQIQEVMGDIMFQEAMEITHRTWVF